MERIRVGIIGGGYWGPNLIRNFMDLANSEVVMVADLKNERLAKIKNNYPQVMVTENYRDFFDQKLDAVVVATPPPSHFPITKDCLEHGLHALVEKPMAVDLKGCDRATAATDRAAPRACSGSACRSPRTADETRPVPRSPRRSRSRPEASS